MTASPDTQHRPDRPGEAWRWPSPAHPGDLSRRQTTPAALLGGGTDTPPTRWDMSVPGALERLSPYDCRQLISAGGIGRIGFVTAGGLMIVPVNFAYDGHSIVVRTGAGSVIAAHADGPVSFQVDRIDDALEEGWSVLIRGQAHQVTQEAVIAHLQRCADVLPWPSGEHDVFVRISPQKISGRRITGK